MDYVKKQAFLAVVFITTFSGNAQAKCDPENITDARLFHFSHELFSSASAIRKASISSPKDINAVQELLQLSLNVRHEINIAQHDWRLHQRMMHPADRELLRQSFVSHMRNLNQEVDDSLGNIDTSIGALHSAGIAALAVRMSDQLKEFKKYIKDCKPGG